MGEKCRGIRPTPGYPACPEHTEQDALEVDGRQGADRHRLTESMAMWPGAAVSGWYFSHPQSQYFVVGRMAQDQVADYAKEGLDPAGSRALARPQLGYNPED